MFNQKELQLLLGGVNTPIDIDDLRRNTNYGGLYTPQQPTIVAFWRVRPQRFDRRLSLTDPLFVSFQVVEGFDAEQRRALLRFVTSVGRPPLLYVSSERQSCSENTDMDCRCSGFSGLVPKFSIRDAGSDQNRLPTSSTCVNLLKVRSWFNSLACIRYNQLTPPSPRCALLSYRGIQAKASFVESSFKLFTLAQGLISLETSTGSGMTR